MASSAPALFLLNSPVLTANDDWHFEGPLEAAAVRGLLEGGFVSAVGHAATAHLLTRLLGIEAPENRLRIHMQPGDRAVVIRLLTRPEPGKTFESTEELAALPHEIGLLTRIA